MRYLNLYSPGRWEQPSLFENFDRLFSDLWETAPTPSSPWEVSESEDAYFLSVDAPGMKRDDIKIEVTGNLLSITGERKREYHEDRRHMRSRSYGQFTRTFTLPEAVDSARIEANFEDGVLEIAVPKTEKAKPRKIEVQSGSSGNDSFFGKFLGNGKREVKESGSAS